MAGQVEKFGKGPYDRLIIESFASHMSAEEVSLKTAGVLSPAQCIDRLNKIVQSKDMLDVEMLAKLNLEDAYYLRNKLRKQMDNSEYISKDDAASWVKAIDAIQSRIEGSSQQIEDALIRMRQVHATVMAEAIRVGYERALLELQKRYPQITREEAYIVLEESMPLAIESLQDNVIE